MNARATVLEFAVGLVLSALVLGATYAFVSANHAAPAALPDGSCGSDWDCCSLHNDCDRGAH